MYYLIL